MRGSARPSRSGFRSSAPPSRALASARRRSGLRWALPVGCASVRPASPVGRAPRPSLGGLAARCPPGLPPRCGAPAAPVPRAVSLARPCPAGCCGPPCVGGRPLRLSGRGLCARWAGGVPRGPLLASARAATAARCGASRLALAPPARALCGPSARPFPRRARASLGLGCSAAAAAAYPVPRLYLYKKWDSARRPTLATD